MKGAHDDPLAEVDFEALVETSKRRSAVQKFYADRVVVPTEPDRDSTLVARPRVMLLRAEAVIPEAIEWLWPGWLPVGKLSILAGAPGTGKTTLSLTLAAAVSRGQSWPDGANNAAPGTVLIWSSEDDPSDTLVPRLMAANADLTRIRFVRNVALANGEFQPFDPARDMGLLSEALTDIGGAQLLILDPILSGVAGDAHKANEVRRSLQPLVDMAAQHRCAVLGISHFAKGGRGNNPADRVIGSQAFVALARMVMIAARDDAANRRILARAKSNIARDDGGIAYVLQMVKVDDLEASKVVWGDLIEGSAQDILDSSEGVENEAKTERDSAAAFLRSLLLDGPVDAKIIEREAKGAGYSLTTLYRASRALDVEKRKIGMSGGWKWALSTRPLSQDSNVPLEYIVKSSVNNEIFEGGAIFEGSEDAKISPLGNVPPSRKGRGAK